jgi:DNA-binding winged helix-turn-helix (wHTH) protein/TolB-like protein/Flp pilus assembly protein TadD
MGQEARQVYEFGPFRVDPAERLLLRDGSPIPLTAKAFDTLYVLVQKNGHLVEKAELINAVWGDSFVEEGNLTVVIHTLRKTLGDDSVERKYIQTVARRGYRFVAKVREFTPSERDEPIAQPTPVPSPPVEIPPTRKTLTFAATFGVLVLALVIGTAGILHLRKASAAGDRLALHSVAVLPLRTVGVGPDEQFLKLGITDAIVTRIASTGQIAVRPTSATAKYANASIDPLAIGREQKVDAILEGNIEVASKQVWVSVTLVRVRDGFILWAGTFHEGTEQLFALEEEVAQGVQQSEPFHLSSRDRVQGARFGTENEKAYELYLQGRYFWNLRTQVDLHRSIDCFQRAIALDPRYALAYAGLANAYVVLGSFGEPPWEVYPNAKVAALKAVELDSSLAAAHGALAMVALHYEWNWSEAQKEFEESIALDPNDSIVRIWYAMQLAATGHQDQAIAQSQRAQDLDPLSPTVNTAASRILYWNREYDRAIVGFGKVIESDPKFTSAHTRRGVVYLAKRDPKNAMSEFEKARQISGEDPYLDGLMGCAQAMAGNEMAARKLLNDLLARSRIQYVPAFSIALVYIGLGDRNGALEWLEKSYQDRSTYIVYAKTDALLDPVRSDPRFEALLRQMGLS